MARPEKKRAPERPGDRVRRYAAWLQEKVEVDGRSLRLWFQPDAACLRCGSTGIVFVGLTDKLWEDLVLCAASCEPQPWSCPKCNGARVPAHTSWCPVEHPEARASWLAQLPTQMEMVGALLPIAQKRLADFEAKERKGTMRPDDDSDLIDEDPTDDEGALDDPRESGEKAAPTANCQGEGR